MLHQPLPAWQPTGQSLSGCCLQNNIQASDLQSAAMPLESTLAARQAPLSAAEVGPQQLAEVEQHFEAETAAGDQGAPAQRQGSGSQVQLERVLWGVDVDDLLQRLTIGESDYDPSQRIRCGTAPQRTWLCKSAGIRCGEGLHAVLW